MNRACRMLLLAAMVPAGLSAGCRTISRSITETVLERDEAEEWRVHYGSRVYYALTDNTLDKLEFEGCVQASDTTVHYQRGLADPARCIADRTAGLLEQVHKRTGVTISTRSTIYLLRFDQSPENFDITLVVEPNEFPLPLFVQVGEESCEGILAQNHSYPYLFVHELVETSLAGEAGGRVLPDLSWGALGLNVHVNNYTRWFRDGLANYAGYVAYESFAREVPPEQRLHHRQTLLHTNPFSALDRVGDRLFAWPQSSNTSYERTYYNAALGLFLLIADTFGEEAIREIVNEIAGQEAVDGRDLIKLTNRVLGADIRRMAETFEFPHIGVELERMSPGLALNEGIELHEGLFVQMVEPNSAAASAGLQRKDVIIAVGSAPVANFLDLELGLFKARRQPVVSLTIHRLNVGQLLLALPLCEAKSLARNAYSGKRENPLRQGKIEFTHLIPFFGR